MFKGEALSSRENFVSEYAGRINLLRGRLSMVTGHGDEAFKRENGVLLATLESGVFSIRGKADLNNVRAILGDKMAIDERSLITFITIDKESDIFKEIMTKSRQS
jgi:hypothetical protein